MIKVIITTVKGMLKVVMRRSPKAKFAMNKLVMVWSLLVLIITLNTRKLPNREMMMMRP